MKSTFHQYKTSKEVVRPSFLSDPEGAHRYYRNLIDFVSKLYPAFSESESKKVTLLDVGCGAGWSTYFFAQLGYQAIGIDLNSSAFEAPPIEGLAFYEGSAQDIPFPDEEFDIVVAYQCIEHVPVPEKMLRACN